MRPNVKNHRITTIRMLLSFLKSAKFVREGNILFTKFVLRKEWLSIVLMSRSSIRYKAWDGIIFKSKFSLLRPSKESWNLLNTFHNKTCEKWVRTSGTPLILLLPVYVLFEKSFSENVHINKMLYFLSFSTSWNKTDFKLFKFQMRTTNKKVRWNHQFTYLDQY